jgi:hypothetical protein
MMPQNDAAKAYMPAITALRADLADLDRRAADTRALIGQLCAHAGIADEPAARPGDAAVPSSAAIKGERKAGKFAKETRGKGRPNKLGGSRKNPPKKDTARSLADRGIDKAAAPAKPDDKAAGAELPKVVAVIAEASAQAAGAMHDADRLGTAIATRARAERRAGELLIALEGRLRPLPGISKVQSRKYRRDAELPGSEFEARLARAQIKAVAAIGVAPKRTAPAKAKPAKPERAAPVMRISPWTTGTDGVMTRALMAEPDGAT